MLARRRSIDQQLRENMHSALLASQNPTAPKGYTKPEALHGSPWGFEILASGELKGGVNDTKGGWASLEGQVFFSDRTQGKTDDLTTRKDLRSKARDYSEGKGIHSSSPYSRAFQHRMTQALDHHFASGKALNATGDADIVEMEEGHTMEQSATL
ncbi:hypothetical protein [Erwinia oleae]|uniref:hypothetical protein n=1 Tax=Erwinia oleae TaxID=796334 RepID=UPI00068E43DE|nr:hypothetical protein [Erwinia oleae]